MLSRNIIPDRGWRRGLIIGTIVLTGAIPLLAVLLAEPGAVEVGRVHPSSGPPEPTIEPAELALVPSATVAPPSPTHTHEVMDWSGARFKGAYIHGVAQLEGGRSMIRLIVPRGVEGQFEAVVMISQPLEYDCFKPNNYEDRLYCYGPAIPFGWEAVIRVFDTSEPPENREAVFEREFLVAGILPTPTDGRGQAPTLNVLAAATLAP